MKLSDGKQRKKLHDALIDAFPDNASLGQMLSLELNKNLDEIAIGSNLQETVLKLVQKAESEGWIVDLVHAALESNPKNLKLQTFAQEFLTGYTTIPKLNPLNNVLFQGSTNKLARELPNMQRIHYNGRVIDRKTQAPIDGAKVSLEVQGTPSVAYSDTEGTFKFTVNFDDDSIRSGQVWVEAKGYEKYNRFIELLPANTDLGNFRLDNKINFLDGTPIQVKVAILTAVIGPIIVLVATNLISSLPLLGASSSYKDGTLIRGFGLPPVYIMQAGQRRWIQDPETLRCMGSPQIQDISIDDLKHIPPGLHLPSRKDGALLKLIGATEKIYIIQSCQPRFIADNPESLDQRLHRDAIQGVYEEDLKNISEAFDQNH